MKFAKKLFIMLTMLLPMVLFAGCNDKVSADALIKIEVSSDFVNKTFYVGSSIDTENYTLKLTYSSGYTTFVKLKDAIISGVNSSVAGKNTITITYNKVSQEVDIFFVEAKVDAIRYAGGTLHFYVGETPSFDGLTILVHKENGVEEIVDLNDCTIGNLDLSFSDEERELEVCYGDAMTTIKYDVSYRDIDLTKTYLANVCFDQREFTASFNETNSQIYLNIYIVAGTNDKYLIYSLYLEAVQENLYSTHYQLGEELKELYVYLAGDTLIVSETQF